MSPRAAVLLPLAVATGCSGCPEKHPYVPYSIDGGAPRAETSASAAPGASAAPDAAPLDAGPEAAPEPAIAAPAGATSWSIDGTSPPLTAPEGTVFVSGLLRDFDGDGTPDAFALVRGADAADAGQAGELLFYRSASGAPASFAPPAGLAHEGTCAAVRRLATAGPRAVQVELGARCAPGPAAPERWFAIVGVPPGGAPSVRLAVTVADPEGSAPLSLDGDAADRDHDGRPDATVRVALEGGAPPFEPGPRVVTMAAWLDRPAGLGRDVTATEAAFAAVAGAAATRARSGKEAAGVPALVEQSLALWRALCADDRSQRRLAAAGIAAGACGSGRPLEELGLAEVRSYVTTGDAVRAALALERAERPPATRTAARAAEAAGWIAGLAPASTARSVRAVLAVPQMPRGKEPGWGPLAFEPSGKLLVRTRAGVARVDPEAGDEADADGVKPWPTAVTSPAGELRWIEAYDPCDGVAVHATFAPSAGDDVRDLALPVAPPLGDRCGSSRGVPTASVPLAWGPAGLEALVDGRPLLFAPDLGRASALQSPPELRGVPGAPVSPDGRTWVVPGPAGLLVRGAGKPRLLRLPKGDAAGAGDDRACAVSDDGARVACVRGGRAWVAVWDR